MLKNKAMETHNKSLIGFELNGVKAVMKSYESIPAVSRHDDSESHELVRDWLTTEEAADYLGLSIGSVRNMASAGQLPFYKLGRRNRYRRSELQELLLSQKRGRLHGDQG